MNTNQKRLTLIYTSIFLISIFIVPTELSYIGTDLAPKTNFEGFTFLWNVGGEIALKHIFVEWFGLLISYTGFYFYLKVNES